MATNKTAQRRRELARDRYWLRWEEARLSSLVYSLAFRLRDAKSRLAAVKADRKKAEASAKKTTR